MNCKVLKSRKCEITQEYSSKHPAIDLVGNNYTLDYIIAHSDGMLLNYKMAKIMKKIQQEKTHTVIT